MSQRQLAWLVTALGLATSAIALPVYANVSHDPSNGVAALGLFVIGAIAWGVGLVALVVRPSE